MAWKLTLEEAVVGDGHFKRTAKLGYFDNLRQFVNTTSGAALSTAEGKA